MTVSMARERLLAGATLAGFLALAGAIALGFVLPVMDASQALTEAQSRIDRFSKLAKADLEQTVDVSMIVYSGGTVEDQMLSVQRGLVDSVNAAGLQLQQLSNLAGAALDRGLVQHTFSVEATGDIQGWTMLMTSLSGERPAVLVDKIVLRSGLGARGDANMAMQVIVSAYAINGSDPS